MTVYANGLEVACKKQGNKVISAFPDVCFTPPQTPATPPGVPIPYPSFGFDKDTDKGTGTVKIGGETVTQKNLSYYGKTSGTEAGRAPKKGLISSNNTGKEFAVAWSGNVKADGEPVNRFSDLSTNNHGSQGNTLTFPKIGKGSGVYYSTTKCLVGTYDAIAATCNDAGGEAHHIVPDKCFRTGARADASAPRIANAPTLGSGMCICLSEDNHKAIHKAEKDAEGLKSLGRVGLDDLTGKALEAAKDALKAKGEYGTGDVTDVYEACQATLDDLDLSSACIQAAKDATDEQWEDFDDGQTLRTGSPLPGAEAVTKMMKV